MIKLRSITKMERQKDGYCSTVSHASLLLCGNITKVEQHFLSAISKLIAMKLCVLCAILLT